MIYRVYARTFDQRVLPETRTVTGNPLAAERAFRDLMLERRFWATNTAAVLTLDSRHLEFRRFDRIVPIDEDLAKKLRHKQPLPPWPRLIYPMDKDQADELLKRDEPHILCTVDPRIADAPFFDEQEPVKLFHD